MLNQPELMFTPADFEDLSTQDLQGLMYLLLVDMLPESPASGFQPTRYELVLDNGDLVTVERVKGTT